MRRIPFAVYGLVALGLGSLTACGADSTNPTADSLSPTEARTVAAALFNEISRAATSSSSSSTAPTSSASLAAAPTLSATVNATCSLGGTLKGSFEFTNDVNSSGTGTRSGAITVTAAQCVVSTGTRTIAADGSLTYTFSVSLTNNVPSSNFVWNGSGTLNWTGGSCTLDYSVQVTPQGAKSLTGTVCGVDVTGTD
jgi:hypothetical protein